MKQIPKKDLQYRVKQLLQGSLLSSSLFINGANATDLDFPQSPLVVTGTSESNLMVLFDTSGSMRQIVVEEDIPAADVDDETYYRAGTAMTAATAISTMAALTPYDPTRDYLSGISCIRLAAGSIDVRVSSGRLFFGRSSTHFDWGTGSGQRCFDPDGSYRGLLQHWTNIPGGAGSENYSGHYLNWYFSNASSNGGVASGPETLLAQASSSLAGDHRYRKMASRDRLMVSISALKHVTTGLNDMRLGLSTYQYRTDVASPTVSTDGTGYVLHGLWDIDDSAPYDGGSDDYRTTFIDSIDSLDVTANTPLTSATAAMGMYFLQGGTPTQHLTTGALAHSSTAATIAGTTLFGSGSSSDDADDNLFYADAARDKPTSANPAIQAACQASYLLTLTDGAPSVDHMHTNTLAQYQDDHTSSSSNWDDAVAALYDIDLRPDLLKPVDAHGDPLYINNVTSYIVAFGDALTGSTVATAAAANSDTTLFNPMNEPALIGVLEDVTGHVASSNGSLAAVAFSASDLNTDFFVFQVKFHTKNWTGSLEAYEFDVSNSTVATSYSWEAREKLNTDIGYDGADSGTRVVLSYDGDDGIAFRWDADGSDSAVSTATQTLAMQNDLRYLSSGSLSALQGQQRLNYLRGDFITEAATTDPDYINYRERRFGGTTFADTGSPVSNPYAGLLGDIVNSAPVYVGAPESAWPDTLESSSLYSTFVANNASRAGIVYVGANDGMLHGFQVSDGTEVLAYVPGMIANATGSSGLHYLTQSDYNHQNYVDLTPSVGDVYIDPAGGSTQSWRTVLIGGLRAGGKGYYALDITDPSLFSESSTNAEAVVLWEFTADDDADIGYSFARPVITKTKDGWAAIFGNGYNSVNGEAKLFVVFIEEGVDGTWSSGDWIEIGTGVGNASAKNGLTSPAVADLDGDGIADRVYAGDLRGNMWVFDITHNNSRNWDLAFSGPLINVGQPITEAPVLARNIDYPAGSGENVLVLFGTGKYIEAGDLQNTDVQAFYGVSDNGALRNVSDLKRRVLDTVTQSNSVVTRFFIDDTSTSSIDETGLIDWAGGEGGWYFELNAGSGTAPNIIGAERVVTAPLLREEVVLFNTIVPDGSLCQTTGGSGFKMIVDFNTGLAPTAFASFDTNQDGVISDATDLGGVGEEHTGGLLSQPSVVGNRSFTATSSGELLSDEVDTGSSRTEGRMGWEEVRFQ